jgi:single-strand DNA-binding protein
MNKVLLIGNLGQDPELVFGSSGIARCRLSVATNERWTNKDGSKGERTEWHRIVLFNKLAENAFKFLKKGSMVSVEGKIQTNSFTDNEGVQKHYTNIVAQSVQFLANLKTKEEANNTTSPETTESLPAEEQLTLDSSEVPF